MNIIKRIEWFIYKKIKLMKLKNRDFTIISSNCNGSYIYHDMGLKYLTPTVNLSFEMNDFVKMVENLEWYMNQEIKPYVDERFNYPTGLLGDIEIHFNHYKTFEEAVSKWEERKKRINWNNIFIIGVDRDNCTYESIKKFDNLPYENKVLFTNKEYTEFNSTYYIKGFENDKSVGVLIYFKKQYLIRRYLDDFDYVKFLNK